jgi:pimeloyl-ACP methyl ester carboxylesterase
MFSELTIDLLGQTHSTREGGSGETVLLLHGAGGNMAMFPEGHPASFLSQLSAEMRVLAPEHPGYGPKERPTWLDNIHDLAYFYLDYLSKRDLSKVHVVGMSLGGWLALEMAVRDCSRFASLTLVGSAGIHVKGVPKGDMFLWSPQEAAKRLLRNPSAVERMLASQVPPDRQMEHLRNLETTALLGWDPRFYDPHLSKWLHRVRVPTHIIWAEHDEVFPLPYAHAFVEHIPSSKLTIIPDCGHLAHIDRPDALRQAIVGFVAGVK